MSVKTSEALNRHAQQGNVIQTKKLKIWADTNLPASSRIRRVLLLRALVYEFLAKMNICMKLVDLEERSQKRGGASYR